MVLPNMVSHHYSVPIYFYLVNDLRFHGYFIIIALILTLIEVKWHQGPLEHCFGDLNMLDLNQHIFSFQIQFHAWVRNFLLKVDPCGLEPSLFILIKFSSYFCFDYYYLLNSKQCFLDHLNYELMNLNFYLCFHIRCYLDNYLVSLFILNLSQNSNSNWSH